MIKKFCYILIIINIALIIIVYKNYKQNGDITVYNMEVYNSDLRLVNFTLVATNDFTYIPDSYYIEQVMENKKYRNIRVEISSEESSFLNFAFQFDNSKVIYGADTLSDIKINHDTLITFKFNYIIDNVEKEFIKKIKLKNHIKYLK